jgi:trk system potassium uptake protein TrkA
MGQYAVIGLGNFGYQVATLLYEKGNDVLAIDRDASKIENIKDKVTQAVVANATNKDILSQLITPEIDVVIVSLGDSIEASIMITLYLKELQVKSIIVKASSDSQAKVLNMIGATDIIFPEREMANKLANTLTNPNVIDYLPLAAGYSVIEVAPPKEFLGHTLMELQLPVRYHIQIIAIKDVLTDKITFIPSANYCFKDSDMLILVGKDENLKKFQK